MELVDTFGRTINYLRLSVTDRCNFRCSYCMPPGGMVKQSHADILRYEELLLVARAAVSLGVEKIRITGGEPLVRRGIVGFLEELSRLPGLRHLALTTNGFHLQSLAADLMRAGVQRLNISLDSLNPTVFADITRGGDLQQVLAGVTAAAACGFPIKLNVVVMRGINDAELLDFAELTLRNPYTVRFIEYMPTVGSDDWQERLVSGAEIFSRLGERFQLIPVDRGRYGGPSRDFAIAGGQGTLGVITPISGHFCGDCNRIRVTSTGFAKSCLFSDAGVDLRPVIASGDCALLAAALRGVVTDKPRTHRMSPEGMGGHEPFAMSGVGG